jgi:hypothetical protein
VKRFNVLKALGLMSAHRERTYERNKHRTPKELMNASREGGRLPQYDCHNKP